MNEVTVKKISKMDIAKVVFARVNQEGYDLEGKTVRQKFIDEVMVEANMSKGGASTYYQNLQNQSNGRGLYRHNPTSTQRGGYTSKKVSQAEQQVEKLVEEIEQHRWMVVNEEGQEVSSHKTRSEAQKQAKVNNMKWADRNAA